jgi:hypothetical protein
MRNDTRARESPLCALFRIHHIDLVIFIGNTLSMADAIKFSDERIVLALIRANQKKFCPLAARIIQTLSSK